MINILLSGCNGRMGRVIINTVKNDSRYRIAAGIDIYQPDGQTYDNFPIFYKLSDFSGEADVIVDFSHHTAIASVLNYALKEKLPVVIATTGYTDEEKTLIKNAATLIPIFQSRNMSLGINLISALAKKAAMILGSAYDVEIIEKHHNAKLDAPSGTALMLAEALSETLPYEPVYKYERQSERKMREPNEIGIHSIRGGTIVGEHEIIFAGKDEVVTISHSAASRDVFAHGALHAVRFIIDKPAGLYNMDDIVNEFDL
ncbi:MAG: 4-hydroxy-tetrahydrodipicolinate reductase [Oscillospiraceae bacterium]|nr:4-hydroxy-tetrahydrodipicolinate reductase [Oscillospiraceae bacterium]